MNASGWIAALTTPCLCLAAHAAHAQSRLIGPPDLTIPRNRPAIVDMRSVARPETADSFRLRTDEAARAGSSAMLQAWAVDPNAEVGLGRFTVPNAARPRTHTERMGSGMDPETRRIAGAGMQIRF